MTPSVPAAATPLTPEEAQRKYAEERAKRSALKRLTGEERVHAAYKLVGGVELLVGLALLLPVVALALVVVGVRRVTAAAFGSLMCLDPAFALTDRTAAAIDVEAEMASGVVVRAGLDRVGRRRRPGNRPRPHPNRPRPSRP